MLRPFLATRKSNQGLTGLTFGLTFQSKMPAILSKKDVLDGRAQILNYKRLPNVWYYREVIPGKKRYRTQKIQSAEAAAQGMYLRQ